MIYEPSAELVDLLGMLLDDEITPDQSDRLAEILAVDADARAFYRKLIETHSSMLWQRRAVDATLDAACGDASNLVLEGDSIPGLFGGDPAQFNLRPAFPAAIHIPFSSSLAGWPTAYLIATVVFAIGLTIAAVTYVSHPVQRSRVAGSSSNPQSPISNPSPKACAVARITGMADCRWEGTGDRVQGTGDRVQGTGDRVQGTGDRGQGAESGQWPVASDRKPSGHSSLSTTHYPLSTVSLGDVLALKSGLLELTYDTGARVILQGPVSYKVDSAVGGYLAIGKLTAKLEKRGQGTGDRGQSMASGQASSSHSSLSTNHYPLSTVPNPSLATNHYPLFTIKTPTALVTDLGTEFGVEVDGQGRTISHVFRGVVRVQPVGPSGAALRESLLLRANESACVVPGANASDEPKIVWEKATDYRQRFVRDIRKPITRFLGVVDLIAGGDGTSCRRNCAIDPSTGRLANRPQLSSGKPQDRLSSDGRYHRVPGVPAVDGVFIPDGRLSPFPVDSAGHTFDAFPKTSGLSPDYVWAGGRNPANEPNVNPGILAGVDYTTPEHSWLYLHANKGITFDLNAVRKAHPGASLKAFSAVAGNTETYSAGGKDTYADLWVLVDGQVRFRRRSISVFTGAFPVVVPIRHEDRFLTLVATDGEDGELADWIVFGDPQLELLFYDSASDANASSTTTETTIE